jgi:hypothetical protein
MACTRSSRAVVVTALVVLIGGLAGCGDDSGGAAGGCGPITREALDPAYLVHVLDDADAIEYTSDPPTSGPHKPTPPISGVVHRPLSQPVQVGILERGDVLVQYDPALADADRAALEGLAGPRVVVAPNPDLSDPVVATAWLYKRTCRSAAVAALREFEEERVGKGPE